MTDPSSPLHPTPQTVTNAFLAAARARDLDAIMALTSPEVTLKSPIMGGAFVLERRAEVAQAFRILLDDFENLEFGGTLAGDGTQVVTFSGLARAEPFEAIQWMHFDASNRIDEITLYVRPYVGLAAFTRVVGPSFMRPHRRWWAWFASFYGWIVTGAVRVLVFLGGPMVKTAVRRIGARPTIYPKRIADPR